MNDDDFTSTERRTLDEWTPMAPPADFADRVLAARAVPVARVRRRWPVVAIALGAVAAAAIALVVKRGTARGGEGAVAATERTTIAVGDRAVAVAEPDAQLSWREDAAGGAELEQRAGNVFYRVEHGGPFVIHTPGGDVRVTGTCFRVEVEPMKPTKQMIVSGVVGAAIATAVIVTVYEGHVVAETKGTHTELAAGTRATLGGDGPIAIGRDPTTHDELVVRGAAQQDQIARLQARVGELEQQLGKAGRSHVSDAEDGRAWHDPSHDTLVEWAAKCHVRFDEPSLEHFSPLKPGDSNDRGLEPSELDGYNAAMTDLSKQWHDLVRQLYIEATGDTAGADTLSIDAMRREIEEKSPREEHQQILQRLSRERAGMASPPPDSTKQSPLERLVRAQASLGDQSEAAIAKRVGASRASAIRGDGWGSKSDMTGCPNQP